MLCVLYEIEEKEKKGKDLIEEKGKEKANE